MKQKVLIFVVGMGKQAPIKDVRKECLFKRLTKLVLKPLLFHSVKFLHILLNGDMLLS